jgi:biopolymer transport protein ExbD
MKPKSVPRRFRSQNIHLGFQIAPMIDVVFVILLFFIVAAGTRQENALNTVLPGCPGAGAIPLPDPVEVRIDRDGQVYLNGERVDSPGKGSLPEFTRAIREIRVAGSGTGSQVLLDLHADELASYQRVIDVMDVLAAEKIRDVTFLAE